MSTNDNKRFTQRNRASSRSQRILALAAIISLLVTLFPQVVGLRLPSALAAPAPVQTFYVTLPEVDALTVLSAINSAAVTPVTTYFSIAIGVSGTYVYYDQWENGYDSDIANPTNLYSSTNLGGTQIWGNGNCADGFPPNKNGTSYTLANCTTAPATVDAFAAGDVIIPSSSIPIPRNSSVILFDSRDKVGATSSIAMARATWAAGSGTLNAIAHEMYATAEWGQAYESPVGTTTLYPAQGYTGQGMFEYSALSIMAAQNNTTVQIDKDANGSYETSVTLQEGGATLVTGISQGARVQTTDAARPIQVVLVTGDIGSNYESRDINLLPVSAYGSSYWSPVGVNTGTSYAPGPTRLFLYSPSTGGPTHITCKRRAPTPTTVTQAVSARGIVTVDLNDNSGANCYASNSSGAATTDKIIFAIGTVDTAVSGTSAGQAGDWSFTLYPDAFLSTEALVGLGLGKDPTNTTSTENGSPLWVTPACDTYVYVDWDNNGTADLVDLNSNGDTADTVDGISEGASNNGMLITQLKSVRLFEPPRDAEAYDQSGARIWSRTASGVGYGGTPGCNLALAWGQDPRTASAAAPGLDVGTSVPPLRMMEGTKSLALKTDADGDGVLSPGDVATYVITVKNAGGGTVNNVYVYDAAVPVNTTYVANSTGYNKTGVAPWTAISDGAGGAFPLADTTAPLPDGILLGNLNAGETFYVRFDITLGNMAPGVYTELTNCDIAYTGGGNVQSCTTNLVASNDWGDLPDSYGTSLAANGPRHSPTNTDPSLTLKLGSNFDRDLQGQPSTGADGDDLNRTPDDEDGIAIVSQTGWQTGAGAFDVTVASGPGCLNAWIDFTNDSGATPPAPDGNFTKTGGYDTAVVNATTYSEYFIRNLKMSTGTSRLAVTAPPGVFSSASGVYFRFRLSPTDGSGNCTAAIAPTGYVAGGEVEDYLFVPVDLAVTKTDGLTSVKSGDTIVYTLQVSNVSASTATGVTLEDTIDANLTYQSSTCPGYVGGSTYTWNLGDLAAGASTSCTVTVRAALGLPDNTQLTNYARVRTTALEVNVTNSEVSDIDVVYNPPLPDLQVTKSDGAEQVLAGGTLVYTIGYKNVGTATATGVQVTDVLPANVTYVSAVPTPTTPPCTTCIWSVADVPVNGTGSIQVTVQVNTDQLVGAVVLNRASISENETEPTPADNSTTDSDIVIAPYVVIEKRAAGLDPVSGQVTYAIHWYSNSTATAANVQIVDTLPANTTLVAGSITGGGSESGGVITWSLGDQAPGASGTVSFKVTVNSGVGSALQTTPTLSTETGTGDVTVVSKTSAYSSLPWCDSTYNIKCLTYRGLYQNANGIGPTGWADNPRATAFVDTSWSQPTAASTMEASYWLPATALDAEWTAVNTTGMTTGNYTFFRQAFCLPLNASSLGASLKLASDDTSTVYLNGVSLGQHTGAGAYSTLAADSGVQSGINVLAIRLLNNSHGGHPFPDCPRCDHSGLLFNLQASYGSLRPFASAPAMVIAGQSATISVDENALGGRKPYSYKFDFGDGTVVDFQSSTSQSRTYNTPGTYVATVTARAAYGCTGTDQVTITVLPSGTNLLANTANVTYQSTGGTNYSGQSGAGTNLAGTIGDTVWLDENGNGVQDAGEAGIANVTVELWNAGHTTKIATAVTDANGNYVFTNVPAGTYQVDVVSSSLPAGLAANPTYDENGTGTANTTSVTLMPGEEHMTADFGYNWAATTDVTGNTGTGAIGDRVWVDANGNGKQDPGKPGLAGATVTIYYDPDGNGVYDTIYPNARDGNGNLLSGGTTTTDANGNYIFDALAAGAYVVQVTQPSGYSQTGDPDQPGVPCATCDNKTTTPIVLAPGDVYVDADFGYKPDTGTMASIGDQVWLDANANGMQDGAETGVAGVTVALIKDTNGNGVWDANEPIVATTVTDANGYYQFTGVPADALGTYDYLVWVNDTANVLAGLAPTYDSNGVGTANISAATDLAPSGNLLQDFGYAPVGQTARTGVIGDTIFWDHNSNGVVDPGEGIPGVKVYLCAGTPATCNSGNAAYTAYTDANGNYTFGNLAAGSYTVAVDSSNFGSGYPLYGLTNAVDPDGGTANTATVSLATNSSVNLSQDFGYSGTDPTPNSIGDKIWLDADRNGTQGTGEPGIAGVTVQLTWAGPDGSLATTADNAIYTTVTAADGSYLFANLPDGNFRVDVPGSNFAGGPLEGLYPAYDATTPLTDNTSTVTGLGVGDANPASNLLQDFGYSPSDGAGDEGVIGDTIFWDGNGNKVADPGEGIPGVKVYLCAGIPTTCTSSNAAYTTYTDANGNYTFGNLAAGSYTVAVDASNFGSGYPLYGLTNAVDPDGGNNNTATVSLATNSSVNLSQDFGYSGTDPTLNSIGDKIWLDADRNGTQGTGEPGIAGVTVQLTWAGPDGSLATAADNAIYTTVTAADGSYLFANLPDGNFRVDVPGSNFAGGPLEGLYPAYDATAPMTDNTSTVTGLGVGDANPANNLLQDFGYAVGSQPPLTGLIGDAIFLDRNGDRSYDAGEGIEGVTVRLYADANGNGTYDAGERLLAQTTTDENGNYYFANLPAGNYAVVVDPTTLPGGVTNTFDPNQDALLNEAGVTLADGGINLSQDFGYQGANAISGTIWNDANADGVLAGETGRLAGVTVALRDSHGNLVATTTTDADGNYSFDKLPNGTYAVDVTDERNVLDGYWHSLGDQGVGSDGTSKADPYTVSVTGGQTVATADFGYYRQPAGLGNRVWHDTDRDGIQDEGETGIANVEVTLTITWPNSGGTTTLKTTTDGSGYYSFGNLLLDENYDGVGDTGEPTYAIAVTPPSSYQYATVTGAGNDRAVDSGLASGEKVTPSQGSVKDTYDFGFTETPLAVDLAAFTAEAGAGGVTLTWETVSETDNAGFNLYRAESKIGQRPELVEGPWTQLNAELIPAVGPGASEGHTYTWLDATAAPGVRYFYRLESVDLTGGTAVVATLRVTNGTRLRTWLPLLMR